MSHTFDSLQAALQLLADNTYAEEGKEAWMRDLHSQICTVVGRLNDLTDKRNWLKSAEKDEAFAQSLALLDICIDREDAKEREEQVRAMLDAAGGDQVEGEQVATCQRCDKRPCVEGTSGFGYACLCTTCYRRLVGVVEL